MKLQRSTVWRTAATLLWIVSILCLLKAVVGGVTAEESLYNSHLTAADQISIRYLSDIADRWAVVGWVVQLATAAALSAGIESKRVVRRIFVSLGLLIAADGMGLLLMAVLVRWKTLVK